VNLGNSVTFNNAIPVFSTTNIGASIAFYEKLGFQKVWHDDEYGIVSRDSVQLHLWKCADKTIAENTGCRIHVTNIQALYDEYLPQQIIHPNAPLSVKPWGACEFAILDNNGNLITFTEPTTEG
jgi:catechol 2,3-dioxygenase-like lactoylglutathione lyase family enzyme